MSIAAVETRSQVQPEASVHQWQVLFAVIARAKSWKIAYFSFPSKSLLQKKSRILLRFGACSSLGSTTTDGVHTVLDSTFVCYLAPLAGGAARVPVSVSPGCHTNGPAIHTSSQPVSRSSECVVSIRLLLLCQGKTAIRVFFRSFLCSSCFLISRQRLLFSDVSLK